MAKQPIPSPAGQPGQDPNQPLRIAVKFRERVTTPPARLAGLDKFLEGAAVPAELRDMRVMPLFESLDAKRLDELVDRARRITPGYEPAPFGRWAQIVCPSGVHPDELLRAIQQLDDVETAYVMRPGPPPVSPADDPRNANQGYLDAAPNGIDARYAWSLGVPGVDGAGIGFVDMEQGWNLNHEDLAAANITIISGTNTAYFSHGTSVLGEVLMVDNTLGGVGIAPAATGRVVSQHRPGGGYNTPDAILDAAANMAYGDVLLLEAQEYDPVGGLYFWPVEIADATYEAIRLATALGVIVVEAACNGGYDLDAYVNAGGQQIFNRGAAGFRDSGAIVVGGSSAAAPHTPVGYNFGSRVDCYAWGQSIDTTSTNGAGTDNTAYTGFFGGTSGASPIVVGAALIIQGIAQASLGYRFSPAVMRRLLTTNGTPSANPAADRIGVMPDLHAIITGDLINLAPDLYLRDQVGDDGNPTSGFVSRSPDIIVRTASVADPQAAFGEGSGTENDALLSDTVQAGSDHFVYVRALNRGGADAVNASVDVYWSTPATLVTPNLWNPIGSTTIATIPIANELTVSDEIVWGSANVPGPGHYCFVAVAGNALDPKPTAATFATFDQFLTYIENNNNVAWRNFDVIPAPPSAGATQRRFLIPGAFDTSRRFDLESIGRLPRGSRVTLGMPGWLAEALSPLPAEVKYDPKTQMAYMPLHPSGRHRLGTALLHAKSAAECVIQIQLPARERRGQYDFAIRQIYKEKEVGRLTWHFVDERPGKGYDDRGDKGDKGYRRKS